MLFEIKFLFLSHDLPNMTPWFENLEVIFNENVQIAYLFYYYYYYYY